MNRRTALIWTGIALVVLTVLYVLGTFLQDVTLPELSEFPVYPLVIAAALLGIGVLAYVTANNFTANWGWPRAVVVLAVIAIVGYVLWEYRTTSVNPSTVAGGSTPVPVVDTTGLGGLGTYQVPPPGVPQRGSPGATSWDSNKPPMAAEPKAPAFVLATGLDASKPFAGDLSQARWCEMCASGKLRQKSYDRLGCNPDLCK